MQKNSGPTSWIRHGWSSTDNSRRASFRRCCTRCIPETHPEGRCRVCCRETATLSHMLWNCIEDPIEANSGTLPPRPEAALRMLRPRRATLGRPADPRGDSEAGPRSSGDREEGTETQNRHEDDLGPVNVPVRSAGLNTVFAIQISFARGPAFKLKFKEVKSSKRRSRIPFSLPHPMLLRMVSLPSSGRSEFCFLDQHGQTNWTDRVTNQSDKG